MYHLNDSLVNTKLDLILSDNSSIHVRQYFIAYKKTNNGFINHNNNFLVKANATLVLDKFQELNNNFHISNDCMIKKNLVNLFLIHSQCQGC